MERPNDKINMNRVDESTSKALHRMGAGSNWIGAGSNWIGAFSVAFLKPTLQGRLARKEIHCGTEVLANGVELLIQYTGTS